MFYNSQPSHRELFRLTLIHCKIGKNIDWHESNTCGSSARMDMSKSIHYRDIVFPKLNALRSYFYRRAAVITQCSCLFSCITAFCLVPCAMRATLPRIAFRIVNMSSENNSRNDICSLCLFTDRKRHITKIIGGKYEGTIG